MLYSDDEREDLVNTLAAIDGFAEGLGIKALSIDVNSIESVLRGMRNKFPAQGGTRMASPFKKAANFLCYFVSQQPVKNPFSAEIVGTDVAKIVNHQNSMVGLHIAFDALHGAKIYRDNSTIILDNKIKLSNHSYIDTVEACANIPPISHFHLVSVFLEQMCYSSNPTASYKLVI